MIYINCEITLNCAEARKGPCNKHFTKVHQFYQNKFKISMRKNTRTWW